MILIALTLFILPIVSSIFWILVFLASSILLYWIAWFLAQIGIQVDLTGMHLPGCLLLIICLVSFYIYHQSDSIFIPIINFFCGVYLLFANLELWTVNG
jgi:hypothetical protein